MIPLVEIRRMAALFWSATYTLPDKIHRNAHGVIESGFGRRRVVAGVTDRAVPRDRRDDPAARVDHADPVVAEIHDIEVAGLVHCDPGWV